MCYEKERQRGYRRKLYSPRSEHRLFRIRDTYTERHGDLPIHSDSEDCHPSALLEPDEKEKATWPQKLRVHGHLALSLVSDGICVSKTGGGWRNKQPCAAGCPAQPFLATDKAKTGV